MSENDSNSKEPQNDKPVRVWVKRSLFSPQRPVINLTAQAARRSSTDGPPILSPMRHPNSFRRHSTDGPPPPGVEPPRSASVRKGRSLVRSQSVGDDNNNNNNHVPSKSPVRNFRSRSRGRRADSNNNSEADGAPPPINFYEWALAWMRTEGKTLSIELDRSEHKNAKHVLTKVSLGVDRMEHDVLLANRTTQTPPHDLVTLDHFHEPTVLECLQRRYEAGLIYTSTGPVLIALNPFRALVDLYSEEQMERYWNHAEQQDLNEEEEPLSPHVFSIADSSFRNMMRGLQMAQTATSSTSTSNSKENTSQSILVSGESGAGKTVTTKYIMKYLAALSQRANQSASGQSRAYQHVKDKKKVPAPTVSRSSLSTSLASTASLPSAPSPASSSSIETQVLQSNPILESFGNARTVRNDNSSRFGKFIQMQFSETGRLLGTVIETYLLEKVRVVHQNEGERNYHIFYELLSSSLSEDESKRMHLSQCAPEDFKLLSSSSTRVRRDGIRDADTFQGLVKAMRTMGFSPEERANVLTTTAALMHGSNVAFSADDEQDGCTLVRDNPSLSHACELLQVSLDDLEQALCFFSRTARGQVFRSPQTVANATKGLDALLKATYGALFEYLVRRVNESILSNNPNGEGCTHASVIGVLDIFGFESFKVNSFEQLCINYCNEILQQQFNTFMLKNEQAEYLNEGIDWDFVQFPENQNVLDLIDDKASGIMSLLDDMCKAPGATEKGFLTEIRKRCGESPCFKASETQDDTILMFGIQHYAGAVEYTVAGFIEKNRNELPRETCELLRSSRNPFIQLMAETIEGTTSSSDGNSATDAAASKSTRAVKTVGGFFRQQVKDLRQKIDKTHPHYVRCIKPNTELLPGRFNVVMVAQQLRCGGILQAISVTRDGFTLHYSHEAFLQRYGMLVDEKAPKTKRTAKQAEKECRDLVDVLLKRIEEEEGLEHQSLPAPEKEPDSAGERTNKSNKDLEEILIQFGKTKVLLKHHAFESLERELGVLQNKNATIINARLRRHLCRTAFLCVRDSFRAELAAKGTNFEEWFKDHRELYYKPRQKGSAIPTNLVSHRRQMFHKAAAINRSPRPSKAVPSRTKTAENSKKAAIDLKNQVWILKDGLFRRNPDYQDAAAA